MVKLNADEVPGLAKVLGFSRDDADSVAKELFEQFEVSVLCVTRGGDGAELHTPQQKVSVEGEPVEVVDAVGAGDAFTAALIVSRLSNWPLKAQLQLANRLGGLVASRAGGMPDLSNELPALVQEVARQHAVVI